METLLRYRHNVLDVNSLAGFAGIRGGLHQGLKDVYFIRALGVHQGLEEEIRRLDKKMTDEMRAGRLFYKRIRKLPNLTDRKLADDYAQIYCAWAEDPKAGIGTKEIRAGGQAAEQLGAALSGVLDIYGQNKTSVSESMKKNFAVKLLYWFDDMFAGRADIFGQKKNISMKIAADNIEKEQEYLFFYLLTLTGCDVLLIQSEKDAAVDETIRRLSKEIRLGAFGQMQIPAYPAQSVETAADAHNSQQGFHNHKSAQPAAAAVSQKIVVKIPKRSKNMPQPGGQVPPQAAAARQISAQPHTAAPVSRREKSFEELAQLASSIVMIAVHDQNGQMVSTGSGIMIGEAGYILTNHHVAGGGYFYSVRVEDDENVYQTDELIKYHPVLDLAVMRIQRKLKPLPVYQGTEKLVRGQAVAAIGSPLGLFNSVSNGIISGFRKVDGVDMIQFTAPISHGSSGGAVLNMYGEVIGISTAGFDRGQNINLAVGYENINAFIRGFT